MKPRYHWINQNPELLTIPEYREHVNEYINGHLEFSLSEITDTLGVTYKRNAYYYQQVCNYISLLKRQKHIISIAHGRYMRTKQIL